MTARTLTNFRPVGFAADPGSSIHVDAAGRITAKPDASAKTVDLGGAYLSPGWADLHVHIWHGGTDISVRPEQAGLAHGVTSLADAGSAGEASFAGLREYVIGPRPENIRAFINIATIGLVACNRIPELVDLRFVNVDRTCEVIEANRDVICGVKVRASGVITGAWGIGPVRIAKRVAEMYQLPLMVHIGEPLPMIDEVFALLDPGDIVTHCFNGKRAGSIADAPWLMKMAKRLATEGVRMDTGHGAASYSFAVAEQAIGEGLLPFSISSDLHVQNVHGPVYDLALTVSKLHAAGLDFDSCITAVTEHPREVIGLKTPGIGDVADFTAFTVEDCKIEASDSQGNRKTLHKVFVPRLAVLGKILQDAEPRAWQHKDV